ncbi:MAG: polysaccharide biosynthesis/export family protein [Bacteroidales bacterium]|nr:polysaccharide biosynthesis/export family protein [Bacteroidales bacterium]
MRLKNVKAIALGVALLTLASCVTPRRVNYLQDMTHGSQIQLEDRFEARIAAYDDLSIVVSSSQPNQELVAPFNVVRDSKGGYLVDVDGNIDFPVLGKMHVAGLTRLQLQDTVTARLTRGGYLEDPFVIVRFNTFKIFFIGAGGGKVVNVPNERCTFLEALALSGGLDNFTPRDRIAVMREVNGKMVMRYLDPRSSDVFNDPFFMLHQNDFIITDGMNNGTLRQEVTFWTGMVSTILSMASLLTSIALYRAMNKN